jgi:5-oxopent-3-ene-1,2,5-tricarboxylate decarboxylase/2-hydroxyhepta-2,4-diene-1,7-dioate isomerase
MRLRAVVRRQAARPFGIPADYGAQPTASEEVLSTALGGDWEFRGIRAPARS